MQIIILPGREKQQTVTRVAVYCRVSTRGRGQLESLDNQITHYRARFADDPRYALVEIYYDNGRSGYRANRPGFRRMLADAAQGKFDLIITKSVTRFARNSETVLWATRRLRKQGIGVFFELQRISTLSQESELMLSLYAAFAQAESENARAHTQMAVRRKYEAGIPIRRLEKSLGYRKTAEGTFAPDEGAPLVRYIFELAARGVSVARITRDLNRDGRKTKAGAVFYRSTVMRILRNVAYKGDFIGQKYFVNEERRIVPNRGERPMYFFPNDHIPLVERDLWEAAQYRLDCAARTKSSASCLGRKGACGWSAG